jgi:hypothetical protein
MGARTCDLCGASFDPAASPVENPRFDDDGNELWFDADECSNDWLTLSAAKELSADGRTITAEALVRMNDGAYENVIDVSLERLVATGKLRSVVAYEGLPGSDEPSTTWTRYEVI